MHIIGGIVQGFAAIFLICVGWLLAGDFSAWWRLSKHAGNPKLAGLVMFALYFAALMLYRYGPIKP